MIHNLYSESEQDIDRTLLSLSCLVDKDYELIKKIKRVRQYYDEPKFWYYSVDLNDSFLKNDGRHFHSKSSGASLHSQKEALLKCLCESTERYCNFFFKKESTVTTKSINHMNCEFIDPRSISSFSKNQLKKDEFKKFTIDNNSVFRWTDCISLLDDKQYLIPSQFIYLSYPYLKNEPSIYSAISTGVAGGANLSAAIVRGICEVIERDSFMIFYLNKITPPKINLKNIDDPEIRKLQSILDRYKFEIVVLDITTDIKIPTIASVIINRSGIGKAISVGLKCDFDILKAISGSIEEALHTRSWLRSSFEDEPTKVSIQDLQKSSDIKLRGFLWYDTEAIKNLDFWICNTKLKNVNYNSKIMKSGEKLKRLIEIFKIKNYDIYYKDITIEKFKKLNYHIVKVIIPKMQPIYLNEKYPLLGGDRLYKVPEKLGFKIKSEKELNKFPHPFL
ncbi:MAG: YcaO-like family protein [Candidatus Woesebacteria bacterium]|nr:YcaO-like family protein [Candidatus Woesebacteria bacterium]